jgi:GDP-L-fucose synthase
VNGLPAEMQGKTTVELHKEGYTIPEVRNCHINVGTGKELTIAELADLIKKTIGYEGTICWDETKPDGTMRKLIDVSKLHQLGWHHQIEIEEGVRKLVDWYRKN